MLSKNGLSKEHCENPNIIPGQKLYVELNFILYYPSVKFECKSSKGWISTLKAWIFLIFVFFVIYEPKQTKFLAISVCRALPRGVFKAQLYIYNGGFFEKIFNG